MRSSRFIANPADFQSSFLSVEKDTETIIRKLFVDSKPYSDILKRLLLINNKDCIDDLTNQKYLEKIQSTSIKYLLDNQYVNLKPKVMINENEEVKNYLNISFDNFTPNPSNSYYRDNIIMIDIICHTDYWDLDNYRLRPIKIAGYIDGILNNAKLSGLGKLVFLGANEIVLSEDLSGYCLIYQTVHGNDDKLEEDE